jgi:cytochrome c553
MKPKLRPFSAALLLVAATVAPAWLWAAADSVHGVPSARPAAMSPGELRTLLAAKPKGDAARGETLHQTQFCVSCHGPQGVAPTANWPHVAGQRADYTYKMLVDYQRGLRSEGERARLMHDVARDMNLQDMADLAAWYATLPLPVESVTPRPVAAVPVEQLVRKGDAARLITPCASCHGAQGQGGRPGSPALARQNPQYFVRTLQQYHGGQRDNDPNRGMRVFAQSLTLEEMEALATYYADLTMPRR